LKPSNQETKKPRSQEAKKPRNQETKKPRNQPTNQQTNKQTRAGSCEPAKKQEEAQGPQAGVPNRLGVNHSRDWESTTPAPTSGIPNPSSPKAITREKPIRDTRKRRAERKHVSPAKKKLI
jgi:hypothetical protein